MSDAESVAGVVEKPVQEPANEPLPRDFGAMLRAAREAAGLTVPVLAMRLRLHVKQVEALERCDLAALPSLIYVRGFLRSCARELRIDPQPLLDDLDRRAGAPAGATAAPAAPAFRLSRFGDGSRPIIVVALFLLAVAGVVGVLMPRHAGKSMPEAASTPAPTPATPTSPAAKPEARARQQEGGPAAAPAAPQDAATIAAPPAEAGAREGSKEATSEAGRTGTSAAAPQAAAVKPESPSHPAGPAAAAPLPVATVRPIVQPVAPPAAAAAAGGDALVLHVRGPSWIEVHEANGAIVFSQLCEPGTDQVIHGAAPLSLVVGNAVAVDARFRGAAVDLVSHASSNGVARLTLP